jgi:hypothetical protein
MYIHDKIKYYWHLKQQNNNNIEMCARRIHTITSLGRCPLMNEFQIHLLSSVGMAK